MNIFSRLYNKAFPAQAKFRASVPEIMTSLKKIQDYGYRNRKLIENTLALIERQTVFTNYLSAVSIIKNEASYMPEWLEYHILMGIEKFYIYDNDSTDNIREVLEPYIAAGIVDYMPWSGKAQQVNVCNHCLSKCKLDTRWLLHFDIDEFIVTQTDENIPAYLRRMEEHPAILLTWLAHGTSGHKTRVPGLVMERFKDHVDYDLANWVGAPGGWTNSQVKQIVNPRLVDRFVSPHMQPLLGSAVTVNSKGEAVHAFNHEPEGRTLANIHINHYPLKSEEEFWNKRGKGRGTKVIEDEKQQKYYDDYFKRHNHNDVKNDPRMDKFIPLVKQAIKARYNGAVPENVGV
jgi:Domain of unknown function.